MKLQLPSGIRYGTGVSGEKICLGAMMGRRNTLPQDNKAPIKLRMEKLKWVDGDYDAGGAYWGNSGTGDIYCAWATGVQIFVRATSRAKAKLKVRGIHSNTTFFR